MATLNICVDRHEFAVWVRSNPIREGLQVVLVRLRRIFGKAGGDFAAKCQVVAREILQFVMQGVAAGPDSATASRGLGAGNQGSTLRLFKDAGPPELAGAIEHDFNLCVLGGMADGHQRRGAIHLLAFALVIGLYQPG